MSSFITITAGKFFVSPRGHKAILLVVPAEFRLVDEGAYSLVRTLGGNVDAFRRSFFIESD